MVILIKNSHDYFSTEDFEYIVKGGEEQSIYDKDSRDKSNPYLNISKKDQWREKLYQFLTNSQEQWLIDQFNLIKIFILRNSWEVENR